MIGTANPVPSRGTVTPEPAACSFMNHRRVLRLRVDGARALGLRLRGERRGSKQKRSCGEGDCELAHLGLRLL